MSENSKCISAAKPERQSNFELLRIVSMLMIVASHWGWWSSAYPDVLQTSIDKTFYMYFRTFGQVGVVLFVLISGYFLCKSKFRILALIKLLGQIFCTICFLLILFFVRDYINTGNFPKIGIQALTDWFIPLSSGRWWFVSCYVALFLLSPFLNKMIESLRKNEFRVLLLIFFIFLSIIPSFFIQTSTTDVGQSISVFILIYLIGAYIRLYPEDFKNKWFCFFGAILSLVIFVIGKYYGFAEYRYFVHVISLSVFLFLSFMHINIQNKFINLCAKTTFGVYLLHENSVVRFWLWNDVFAIQDYANTKWFIAYSVISVLITFIVCSVIDYLRQITIEPLLLKLLCTKKVNELLTYIDSKMPTSHATAKNNNIGNAAPIIFLLIADILFFSCQMLNYFTRSNISYKLFLVISFIIIMTTILLRWLTKTRNSSSKAI